MSDLPFRALVLGAALLAAACGEPPAPHRVTNPELLFHPRADGVTLTLVPGEPLVLAVEYGVGAAFDRRLEERDAAPGEPAVFVLDGLPAGAACRYRVLARRPGEARAVARAEHRFTTLRPPGERVRFAVAGDPHTFQNWAQFACEGDDTGWRTLDASLDRLAAARDLDFVLIGTDSAMTKCGAGCPPCVIDGTALAEKDAVGVDDALLRYRTVFGPQVYGRFGADLPLFYMLGDHDGERGWATAEGACGYTLEERAWSREARARTVPVSETFYAVRTGELLLVVLDVLNGTSVPPTEPESWSLGPEQLAWFERTLAASDATFKLVFAEHLLGGLRAPEGRKASICWKARGGITATDDGTPRGRFTGEQAVVQALMEQHGAQLFTSFHDHVLAFGEKLRADGSGSGVGYLIGGQCAGPPFGEVQPPAPPWSNEPWYRAAMDYDGDGVPEYDTGVTGSLEKGLLVVTVEGGERVELEYLRSDPDPARDGERVLRLELLPDGPVTPTR